MQLSVYPITEGVLSNMWKGPGGRLRDLECDFGKLRSQLGGVGVAKWGPGKAIRRPYHESEVLFKGDLVHTLLDAPEYTVEYYCPKMNDLGRKFNWIIALK